MAGYGKNDKLVTTTGGYGKNDKLVNSAPAAVSDPGWFGTGSKTDSAVRGASQAATLGFADELQALVRSLSPVQIGATENGYPKLEGNSDFLEYNKLRDEQRTADANALATNPGSYVAGSIVGSIPQGMGIARSAATAGRVANTTTRNGGIFARAAGAGGAGAGLGAIQGAGNAEEASDIPREAGKQLLIGGATAAAAQPIAEGVSNVLTNVPKMFTQVGRKAADVLPRTHPSIVLPQGAGSLLGALGNVGMGRLQADKADWATDPYSAAVEVGGDALIGAAGGALLQHGPGLAWQGAKAVGRKAGNQISKLDNKLVGPAERAISDEANAGLDPFGGFPKIRNKLTDYLDSVESSAASRKAAMEGQATAKGRAKTNTDSPLRN